MAIEGVVGAGLGRNPVGRATVRTKGSYLAAHYHRVATRRGAKRAIVEVAHIILMTIYQCLVALLARLDTAASSGHPAGLKLRSR